MQKSEGGYSNERSKVKMSHAYEEKQLERLKKLIINLNTEQTFFKVINVALKQIRTVIPCKYVTMFMFKQNAYKNMGDGITF